MAKIFYFISEIDEKETYSKNKLAAELFLVKKNLTCHITVAKISHICHMCNYT